MPSTTISYPLQIQLLPIFIHNIKPQIKPILSCKNAAFSGSRKIENQAAQSFSIISTKR
jgi:hypothetical protein